LGRVDREKKWTGNRKGLHCSIWIRLEGEEGYSRLGQVNERKKKRMSDTEKGAGDYETLHWG